MEKTYFLVKDPISDLYAVCETEEALLKCIKEYIDYTIDLHTKEDVDLCLTPDMILRDLNIYKVYNTMDYAKDVNIEISTKYELNMGDNNE